MRKNTTFKLLLCTIVSIITILQGTTLNAQGVLLINSDIAEEDNKLILDADDDGGDIFLQFGNTLNKYLKWDDTNSYFSLNDDVNLEGNELKNFRVDNLATAPSCDVLVSGRMYHNTTDNNSYICDGTNWIQIDVVGETLAAVQARRSSSFTLPLPNTWYDISLNNTDVETDPSVIEHNNSNTDRIDVKVDGLYRITYHINSYNSGVYHRLDSRVTLNDSAVLAGSLLGHIQGDGEASVTTGTFLAELTNGDFITLQARRPTSNTVVGQTSVTIVKLDGIKGDSVDISTITGTNSDIFTLDQDDTGGNVTLEFGTTLAELLQWDSTNNRFYMSDELQVDGDLLPAADDTYNLGSESLRWRKIYSTEGLEIEGGDIHVAEGGLAIDLDNNETGAGNTITIGNVVKIDTTITDAVILTTNKNDQPIGVATNDSAYGEKVNVLIIGKGTVQCTGTVDIGELIQSSNTDGAAESGNNSTKIVGTALTTCSGGTLEALVHLE